MSELAVGLTPVQRRTLDDLRRDGDVDPRLDEQLAADLRSQADDALGQLGARLDDVDLFVTKHTIASVLACETNYLAPDDFTWTPARARGKVSHRAIQLLLNWRGEPTPADLVNEALARLVDDENSFGDYIAGLSSADEADVRGLAVERVTKFVECFPPLDRRWHPMTEASTQYPISGPIVFRARVDLVIGRPNGSEPRKVIVDLKSGRIVDRHREDLRFYALIETLCRGVPPRRLASFALDSGVAVVEDVTPVLLQSTLRRTLDAVARMVELRVDGRRPEVTPGPTCGWCQLLDGCAPGTARMARLHDPDAD